MNPTLDFITRLHEADRAVFDALSAALPSIARAADAIAGRLEAGGRLGAMDAAELPPTFGTDPSLVVALVAGGRKAMFAAVEGAEDDAGAGARDLATARVTEKDVVVGISASGSTPYVVGALEEAKEAGALTVAVVCRPGGPIEKRADICILLDTGKEVLAGSSRLKAGTAQKIALNMLSTAVMARRGLIYQDEMVAMKPTNEKLRKRAVRIVAELATQTPEKAEDFLRKSNWNLPMALISAKWGLDAPAAALHLSKKNSNVAAALSQPPERDRG